MVTCALPVTCSSPVCRCGVTMTRTSYLSLYRFFATAMATQAARAPREKLGFDRSPRPCYSTNMRKGVPVSPGVAVARAYCVDEVLARREPNYLDVAALSDEVSRFDSACAAAGQELDAIVARVREQVGEEA